MPKGESDSGLLIEDFYAETAGLIPQSVIFNPSYCAPCTPHSIL